MSTTTTTTAPTRDSNARAASGRMGRTIGCLVGCTGWSIGLLLWAIASGHFAALWGYAAGGFVLSLALGLILLCGLEVIEAHARSARIPFLVGSLMAVVGLLMHLINVWIAPAMQRLGVAGGSGKPPIVYEVHAAVVWVLIIASLVPLWRGLRRIRGAIERGRG